MYDDLLARLDDAGRTGLDGSPGDPDAREAAHVIRQLLELNDPIWDGTDVAHPAYWRGSDVACHSCARVFQEIVDGKHEGGVFGFEPLEKLRKSILELQSAYRLAHWLAKHYRKRLGL